ncbi:MAG: hypothetical protein A2X13_14775 [Bacteroidetes bacterium GWC2_33_15]|nr:MAG: hypothetical protein A2X10_06840 [Bacteroidetes bacterium GWA2_33_15]OFX50137.1 MAG: hypothetical protein A2X13_14775 [Bacteroidetes bacterium GWC2_33_15]OFX65290.1 MAG: hypothetical protein A2X15_04350 [Bacteroidetes bacterium GWB2_32_14]OFX70516.1 MAG: hypothetical protein A2X14_04405 [Bacteroidetes bacterium GWD2_33_33]HAN19611.1 hypothetical protein [Bacteroidales bacterium]
MAITINQAPAIVDFCFNKPAFKITSNASPVKLVARIYVEVVRWSTTYEQVPDIYLDPDSNDSAVFYIGNILREYFDIIKTDLWNLADPEQDLYALKYYYVKFYEWDGDSLNNLNQPDGCWMLYGKLDYQAWPGHSFFTSLASKLNYLNNIGTRVRCWVNSKHFIYFLNHVGTEDIDLVAQIFYTDKTNETQVIKSLIEVPRYDVIVFPAGYGQLNIGSFTPAKTVYRYDLSVYISGGAQVGKTVSFYIENKPWFGKQFLFRNNYGVFESMLCEGKEEAEINATLETSKKRLAYDYSATDFEYVQRVKSKTQEFKANTGGLIRSEAEHLHEMLNDKFFKIGESSIIPCNILSKSIKVYNEEDDLHSIEFSYQYAFEL